MMSASAMLTVSSISSTILHELDELGAGLEELGRQPLRHDLALPIRIRIQSRHYLVPDSRHLRPVIGADDSSQDVAAEGGTSLQ